MASNELPTNKNINYNNNKTNGPPTPPPLPITLKTPLQPLVQTFTAPLQRRKARLQRSERLPTNSESSTTPTSINGSFHALTPAPTPTSGFSAWEALVKESFGQIAWPIKITSWELADDSIKIVPNSTSATELISRRGVFLRHHYGSVDQLAQSDLDGIDPNFKRFRVETGDSLAEKDEVFGSPSTPILENPEHQTRWYFKYFLGRLHQNYVGIDAEKNPYFLSVVSQDSGNQGLPMYRAILFRKQGAQKIAIPQNYNQKLTVKQILTHFTGIDASSSKNPKEIYLADIQKDLLLLEEQEGSVNFKFGVVYMKPGQMCDDEMLSNVKGSQDFEDFLDVLGERVRLKSWDRFRGGLDIKGDMTGKYSVYTLYEGHEIMFHVSTLLPFSKDNRQQVERKRHIGNDIVNIVFIDQLDMVETETTVNSTEILQDISEDENNDIYKEDGPILPTLFDPTWIKSQFTHIFAVVTKIGQSYRLAIYCDENVPPFGPTLPNPPEFKDVNMFREFLLVKLINAEKAAFQTPTFSKKRERTLEMLIKDLHEDYASDNKINMLNRRAFSEVLYDVPRTSKLKEDARHIEFVRIGQALKLEAIVRGDAPTSIASASPCTIFRKPPWEPHCYYPTFPHRGTLVGDTFGANDDCLLIATDDGTFLMKEGQTHQLVFDRSFHVRQLSVLEEHGLVLLRGGSHSNREAHRVYVFRLREFKTKHNAIAGAGGGGGATSTASSDVLTEEWSAIKCRSRAELKDRRIERTRGCHLIASSRINGGHLRLVAAVGRKLQLFQWKHTAAWASWCPESDTETVEGFIFQREIQLSESPTIITPLEGPTNTNTGGIICVGYKHHYEIVCDQTGVATRLHDVETTKRNQTQLTAAIELCDGLETELLLCYNHTCHFQKLNDSNHTNDFDFHWNTAPTSVVCAFPYILGFTSDSMEIRLLVNGNLVHTAIMPELGLITSKRDIFFVTTAPEFMTKDLNIKGLQLIDGSLERRLQNTPADSNASNTVNTTATTSASSDTSSNEELPRDNLAASSTDLIKRDSPDQSSNLLELPGKLLNQLSPIQRARSLQKTSTTAIEEKPVISKSNSCSDTYQVQKQVSCVSNTTEQIKLNVLRAHSNVETKLDSSSRSGSFNFGISNNNNHNSSINSRKSSLMSPTKRQNSSKYRYIFTSGGSNCDGSSANSSIENYSSSPDRLKPLRIYRIPLTNLTGTHSQFHMHAFPSNMTTSVPKPVTIQQTTPQKPTLQNLQSLMKRQQSMDINLSANEKTLSANQRN